VGDVIAKDKQQGWFGFGLSKWTNWLTIFRWRGRDEEIIKQQRTK